MPDRTEGQKASETRIHDLQDVGGPFVTVAERTRMPMLFSDPQLPGNPIVYANDSFLALTGYGREEVVGQSQLDFLVGSHTDPNAQAAIKDAFNGRFEGVSEVCYYRKDGSEFWVSVLIGPVLDMNGAVRQCFLSFIDITRQKQAERLSFLLDELKHRVKNTLATVQSITTQTLRSAGVDEQVRNALEGRILALAKAHDLVARDGVEGATLNDVIDQILQPFNVEDRDDRISVEGADVHLQPKAALALAMMFHELVANAAKYGALSNGGQIGIAWQIEPAPQGDRIRLTWRESGGPPVTPPTRRGFGSRLIQGGLAQELQGEVRLDYAPAGVVCLIVMPVLPEGNAL